MKLKFYKGMERIHKEWIRNLKKRLTKTIIIEA